jgi:hypothetical protein
MAQHHHHRQHHNHTLSIESEGAHSKLIHDRLADGHSTGVEQALHGCRIEARLEIRQDA